MDRNQDHEITAAGGSLRKVLPYVVFLVGFLLFAWALISLNARKNSDNMNTGGNADTAVESQAESSSGAINSQASPEAYTITDTGEGNVEVSATYVTPEYLEAQGQGDTAPDLDLDKNYAFAIALNTHSVELAGYEVDKIVYLRDESGQEYPALPGWLAASDSGHHRSGIVRFAKTDASGNAMLKSEAKYVDLVVKDIAGVAERTFRWNLPLGSGG